MKFNPIPTLQATNHEALQISVQNYLLNNRSKELTKLQELNGVKNITAKQLPSGAWPDTKNMPSVYPAHHYLLLQTWIQLRYLVDMYALDRGHCAVARAAEFIFSCQNDEGDFRGFIGNQYATYYTGAVLGLLIKAGYGDDSRTKKGLDWLISMRQNDGGWTIPIFTKYLDWDEQVKLTTTKTDPLKPDRTQPFSHHWTGMVLRAFEDLPEYRTKPAIKLAAKQLKASLFQSDAYTSFQSPQYWLRFQFPFCWNNLVSALDTLSKFGFSAQDPDIKHALDWLIERQRPDGLWDISYSSIHKPPKKSKACIEESWWISLAICRIFKRFGLVFDS